MRRRDPLGLAGDDDCRAPVALRGPYPPQREARAVRLLTALRRRLDAWCLGCDDATRREHARRHQERIAREHLMLEARLEAIQADLSFTGRAYARASKRSSDLIPFPWRLR